MSEVIAVIFEILAIVSVWLGKDLSTMISLPYGNLGNSLGMGVFLPLGLVFVRKTNNKGMKAIGYILSVIALMFGILSTTIDLWGQWWTWVLL